MRRLSFVLIGLLAIRTAALVQAASDASAWPQFRGPLGNGHSTARAVPTQWTATSNVAWKVPIPGQGWSSPVVAQDRVFLTTAIRSDTASNQVALVTLCLDTRTGQLLWQTPVFPTVTNPPAGHAKNSLASPTPLIDGNRIFVHFGPLGTACLDLNGHTLWTHRELPFDSKHGSGGSPVLAENRLIFTCDGTEDPFVAALDADTGRLAWKSPRNASASRKFSFGTPGILEVGGRLQVISPGSGCAVAYEPATGNEIWRVRHDGYSVIPKPIFGHGLVYLGTGFNTPFALAIRPDGMGDVTDSHIRWTLRRGAGQTPSFLLIRDELYLLADNGVLTCANARTGEIHYQERACGPASASPFAAENRIYLLDEQGLSVVIEPGRTFRKLAENPLGERTLASCAAVDGALFIRSQDHLYRIGAGGRP